MGSHARPEIRCIFCNGPIDLQTDLNANENGKAIHEDCYSRSISVGNSSDDHEKDFDLLARVGLGDRRAIASLYDRHSTLVYRVALRVCHDSASAEEVLQNIFMQIWLAPQTFASEPGSLDGRLGLLSRNLAIDLMRRRESSGWPDTRSDRGAPATSSARPCRDCTRSNRRPATGPKPAKAC